MMVSLFRRQALCFVVFLRTAVHACTNVLVTPGASEDGSAMIAYNADSGSLMGFLYHYPPTTGKEGEERRVYEWDTGKFLGVIPEVNETYNVVGNINEFGLCIGESTFGGVEVLAHQNGAVLDYGSLIYITLSRAKTAREAIRIMADLMDTYGYASEGESFSLADRSGEVWIMEVIGRGSSYQHGTRLGAVWVARRLPDGTVSAHANQARIRTFPRDDPDNCLYAPDVVDVAVHYGLYDETADPLEFSFSDVYAPVSVSTARLSEARVWSVFSQIANDASFEETYLDYVTGKNLTHRMPLWIEPSASLSLLDLMNVMNSHYENTALDSSKDVGAGLYAVPYRPRPLEWEYNNGGNNNKNNKNMNKYHNERTIGTQQTGWNFVAQIRSHMPPELSAIAWFAVDDSSTSPRVPVYGSSRRISHAYAGQGAQMGVKEPLLEFDIRKAFWVQNMVSNLAYGRWMDIYPVLRKKIDTIHRRFVRDVASIDQKALETYYNEGIQESIEYVTDRSVRACDGLHESWFQFYGELFARFRDFFEIVPNPRFQSGVEVKETGMTEATRKRIVDETGSRYQIQEEKDEKSSSNNRGFLRDESSSSSTTVFSPETSNVIVAY